MALLVPGGDDVDVEDFLAWAGSTVAGYRRPTAAVVVAELPRGNNGKIDRRAATDLATRRLEEQA